MLRPGSVEKVVLTKAELWWLLRSEISNVVADFCYFSQCLPWDGQNLQLIPHRLPTRWAGCHWKHIPTSGCNRQNAEQNRRYDAKANNTADITNQETPAISTRAHNCKLPGLQPAAPLREAGIPQKLSQPCWRLVSNSKTSTPAQSLNNQPLPTGTDRPRAQVKSYLQNSPRPWKGAPALLSDFLRKTITMVEAQPSCCAPCTSTSSLVNYLHFHLWLLFCSSSSP